MAPLSWRELDWPLRITVLTGILSGFGGILSSIALQSQLVDPSAPPVLLTFLIGSFVSLAGAFCLLAIPMKQERRGIVGMGTFALSAYVLWFLLLLLPFLQ